MTQRRTTIGVSKMLLGTAFSCAINWAIKDNKWAIDRLNELHLYIIYDKKDKKILKLSYKDIQRQSICTHPYTKWTYYSSYDNKKTTDDDIRSIQPAFVRLVDLGLIKRKDGTNNPSYSVVYENLVVTTIADKFVEDEARPDSIWTSIY